MVVAFDNTLWPHSYSAVQKAAVTLNMSQTYLREARAGETIWCEGEVETRLLRIFYMTASMYDERRKLVATAQTLVLILWYA